MVGGGRGKWWRYVFVAFLGEGLTGGLGFVLDLPTYRVFGTRTNEARKLYST